MKIQNAMLCLDCDELGPIAECCPACESKSVVQLKTWLPPKDAAKTDDILGKTENIKAAMQKVYERMTIMLSEAEAEAWPIGMC